MTDKITLLQVGSLQDTTTASNTINTNFTTIQTAFDNTISRDGTAPNQMGSNLDMNKNQILNLPAPISVNSPVRLIDVTSNPTIQVPAVGTSGAVVGLLNANKTDSGNNTFSGNNTLSGSNTISGSNIISGNNTVSGNNTFSGNNNFTGTTTFAGATQFFTLPQNRLTLTSGVPVTTSDVVAATTVYLTAGQSLISNGTALTPTLSPQLSLVLDSTNTDTGYHSANTNFDMFIYSDSGTIRIGSGPSWNSGAGAGSNTARGTGAGSTAISQLGNTGIFVNTNSMVIRWGNVTANTTTVAAGLAVYVGSFRTVAAGQTEDSVLNRYLFNAFNIAERKLLNKYTGGNPTNYSTSLWAQAYGNTANKVNVFLGLTGSLVTLWVNDIVLNSTATARVVYVGIGLDSVIANSADMSTFTDCTSTITGQPTATYKGSPGLGLHTYNGLQYGAGSDTQGWYTTGGGSPAQSGMVGSIWI